MHALKGEDKKKIEEREHFTGYQLTFSDAETTALSALSSVGVFVLKGDSNSQSSNSKGELREDCLL